MSKDRTDFQVRMILKQNRDGSPDRQTARHRNLMRCVRQLRERGYPKNWDIHQLGKREVHRLVHDWRSAGLSHRTIANRMVDIRWLAEKLGRDRLVPSNGDLGIPMIGERSGSIDDRASEIDCARLKKMEIHAQLVTELRREFGLHTSEAIRFEHVYATREPGFIRLARSWCRGRPRMVQVTTERQIDLLERIGRYQERQPENLAGRRTMMPADMTFRDYLGEYARACYAAGIPGPELRHAWAQERFEQLAGFPPPIAGGPNLSELGDSERAVFEKAAETISQELGIDAERNYLIENYIGPRS